MLLSKRLNVMRGAWHGWAPPEVSRLPYRQAVGSARRSALQPEI
jgi:hypothetical protein